MTRKLILIATAVMTTLLALLVLWMFHVVVIYILVSVALAATIRPLLQRLVGKKVIVRIGGVFLYVVILVCIGGILFLAGKLALAELQKLVQALSTQNAWIFPSWIEGTLIQHTIQTWLPAPNQLFKAITGDKGQLVLPAVLNFLTNLGGVITGTIVILFLGIYWSINQIHFERLWLSLLPSDNRKLARGVWRKIEPAVGAYISSQLIQSLSTGLLLALGFWLVGSPYPTLLALVGAMACLVPMIGPSVAVIIILLIGLITSFPLGLITALFALAILIVEEIWLKPHLVKSKWDNHVLTLVLIITLAKAFGIIGIIIAPIISLICQIVWSRLVSHRAVIGAADQFSDIKERQTRVRDKINAMADSPLPLVTSSMDQLDVLINNAEPVLKTIVEKPHIK